MDLQPNAAGEKIGLVDRRPHMVNCPFPETWEVQLFGRDAFLTAADGMVFQNDLYRGMMHL